MSLRDAQTQKALFGAILVAGLTYAFHQYLYTPKKDQVVELQIQAERLESYNQTAKRAAQENRIAELEQESVSYARRLETFEELIPTTEQVPQLLERVATVALETDVDLLSFTPLPAEPGTFYTEQFYEVELRGGYHDIGSFVTRIAMLPRIIKPAVTELLGEQVQPPARGRAADPNAPPPEPETVVRAKLQLSTYVLPGGEAPVVGDTAGVRPLAPAIGSVAPQAEDARTAGAPAPPPAQGAAPPFAERVSPGVAPAFEAERQRAGAESARALDPALPPGAAPDVAAGVAPIAPQVAGAAGATPAGQTAQETGIRPGPAPLPPAPDPGASDPAALSRPDVGDLLPPGGRASGTEDLRPGALSPPGDGT